VVSQSQGYTLAKNAGLSDSRAKLAAAIMMAESGGNASQVTNDSDDLSYGLWQINMKGDMGPTRRALYGLKSNDDLLDPATNARVMSAISHQGANFSAWGAYTNQSYKKFTGATVSLVDLPIPGPGGAIVNGLLGFLPGAVPGVSTSIGVLDTVTKVGGAVTNTARWVSNPKNWVRVAYVIGGGILVYAAVESLILPYTTKAVGKVMGVVGPRGKVSKVAGAAKKLGEKANS
jgi:hypothetical protein